MGLWTLERTDYLYLLEHTPLEGQTRRRLYTNRTEAEQMATTLRNNGALKGGTVNLVQVPTEGPLEVCGNLLSGD
jgi:hypothetical protein